MEITFTSADNTPNAIVAHTDYFDLLVIGAKQPHCTIISRACRAIRRLQEFGLNQQFELGPKTGLSVGPTVSGQDTVILYDRSSGGWWLTLHFNTPDRYLRTTAILGEPVKIDIPTLMQFLDFVNRMGIYGKY